MSKSPWGNIGGWAAEAEREEAEEADAAAKYAAAPPPTTTFPTLKESVTKQKKKTKMTLQEFTMQQQNRGLTPQEMLRLPTGPKDRSLDETQFGGSRLGGGFSNYGGSNHHGVRSNEYEGRRSYRFDDDNDGNNSNQVSRSDGVDNWASMKQQQRQPQTVPDNSFGRTGSKYGVLGGGGGGISSRADDVDNWASKKQPVSKFEPGFSRFEPEVVVGKGNRSNPFGAARPREDVLAEKGLDWKKLDLEVDGKNKQQVSVGDGSGSRPTSSHSGRSEVVGEGVVLVKERAKMNPFGDAKPREVLLQEKGLDWKKIDLELEHRRVDRPETEEEKNLKEEIENMKKEVLQKSGEEQIGIQELIQKMEHELEQLVRELDDKVRYTQKIYERPGSGSGRPVERPPSRPGSYDESRAGSQDRPPSRPGSYDDSRTGYPERPPSRPGAYEDLRINYNDRPRSRPGGYEEARGGFPQRSSSMSGGGYQEPRTLDYNERPRSRGTPWARPSDDRRGIQGGGGRGFFGSIDVDRSGSRW